MAARAFSDALVQTSLGPVRPGVVVTLYEEDGTTPFASNVFAARSGGSPLASITADTEGIVKVFMAATDARPIQFSVAGDTNTHLSTPAFDPRDVMLLDTAQSITGVKTFGAGAAAAPIVAIGSANAGLYAPSSGVLGLTAGGAEKARLSSTGLRLGTIGAPTTILEVVDPITLSGISNTAASHFAIRAYAGNWSATNEGRDYQGAHDYIRGVILGAVEIPSDAQITVSGGPGFDAGFYGGIVGLARTSANSSAGGAFPLPAVGVYGQATAQANSTTGWGANFVAYDSAGQTVQSLLRGVEVNLNHFSASSASVGVGLEASFVAAPTVTTSVITLLSINAGFTGEGAHGFAVSHQSTGAGNRWTTGFSTLDGSTFYGLLLGTGEKSSVASASASQYLAFRSRTADVVSVSRISAFTNGAFIFQAGGSAYSFQHATSGAEYATIGVAGLTSAPNVATTANGAKVLGLGASGPHVYVGSGAPTVSAVKGSLYLRTDGSGTTDRMYVNTNASTTWTAVTTVA